MTEGHKLDLEGKRVPEGTSLPAWDLRIEGTPDDYMMEQGLQFAPNADAKGLVFEIVRVLYNTVSSSVFDEHRREVERQIAEFHRQYLAAHPA